MSNPSLLETLKELENLSRVDSQDPEDEDFEGGKVSMFQEEEEEGDNKSVKNKFGNLRKKTNEVVEKKYAGEKSSRRSLMAWSDDEEDEVEDEEDEDEVEDEDQDADDTDGEESEEDMVNGDGDGSAEEESDEEEADVDADGPDDEEEEEEEEEDNVGLLNGINNDVNDDDDDDDNEGDDVDEFDDGMDDMDNEMNIDFSKLPADLQQAVGGSMPDDDGGDGDNDDPLAHFTSSRKDDNIAKGEATKSQLNILDKLLESRIRLQKSLHVCNQLPQHDTMQGFRNEATPQVKEAYESAKSSMKELLNKLLVLQDKICETNTETSTLLTTGSVTSTDPGDEEIPSDTEDEDEDEKKVDDPPTKKNDLNLPSKRKHTLTVDEYREEVVKRHKAFQGFQESTINKWHEKTRLASSVSSKNFASFDKSVTQQIKQVLSDKERLIKRTQLSRVPLNILGKKTDDEESKNGDDADLHLKNYNENIFDDGDFYHEMLKELIERKSNIDADDPVAAGRRWLELQKLRSKIKRKVDTRASKGRKVRYDVHTKLVSFMAPQNVGPMGDQARNNLFASLFGQKPVVGFGA